MKITSVECEYLQVAVQIPVRETYADYGLLLVTLETDTGIRGLGIAREHDFHSLSVRQLLVNDIGTYLKSLGDNILPASVWHEASFDLPRSDYRTASGIYARAASAVDQALWDIYGKSLNQPIYKLLGGAQSEIEIYATFGLNIYTAEEETEAAKRMQKAGFKIFKLQGANADRGRNIAHDAGRVKRLREAVGDDAQIILDGRNDYTLFQAIELTKMVEPYNMAYFDEPVYARDPLALKQLRIACPRTPLAARGNGGTLYDNRDLIASGTVDVMGTNVLDQGGYTQSIKVAHMAQMYQLPVVTGGAWHLQNAHLIAAMSNGWMTEYHALAAGVSETLFADPPMPKDGKIRLSDKPGLGLTLDDAAVREARERARAAEKKEG